MATIEKVEIPDDLIAAAQTAWLAVQERRQVDQRQPPLVVDAAQVRKYALQALMNIITANSAETSQITHQETVKQLARDFADLVRGDTPA